MPLNVAIWASGNGTNAENIFNFFSERKELANIAVLMCNKKDAFVLQRANKFNVPTFVFSYNDLTNSTVVDEALRQYKIDFIVLSGFMLKVPERITSEYNNRIVNIHPALLPKFGGKGMYGDHVHQAVIDAHETESGITIHYANEHYDSGAVIFQAKCPVFSNDTADALAQRIHSLEYAHYPNII